MRVAHVAVQVKFLDGAKVAEIHGNLPFRGRVSVRPGLPMPLLDDVQGAVDQEMIFEHVLRREPILTAEMQGFRRLFVAVRPHPKRLIIFAANPGANDSRHL